MKRFRLLLVGLLIVILVFSSQTLARRDVLQLYTALDPNEAKIYTEAFTRDTKINVEWVRLSAGELLTRLKAEAKNPQVSVWFGGSSFEFIAGSKAGVLTPYRPPSASYVPANKRDPNNLWTGFYFGALGFGSNTEVFTKKNIPYPTSWQDLLRPELKNNISLAYPYTSGTSYCVLATLVQLMGEDKAFDYWKKLDQNIHHYNTSGSACVTQTGLGEVAVGIAFSHDIITKGPAKGYPVKMTFPSEGTGYEIGAMALVKGGKDLRLGRKFIDWCFTKRAQDMMQVWNRIPMNPKATVSPELAKINKEIKLIDFNDEWAGENQARLVEKWRKTIGK